MEGAVVRVNARDLATPTRVTQSKKGTRVTLSPDHDDDVRR